MIDHASPDGPIEIFLRIPGRWRRMSALAEALPAGFALDLGPDLGPDAKHLTLPDRSTVEFHPHAPDEAFPRVFAISSRRSLSRRIRRSIERYTMNACLVGAGGSVEAARRMVGAAAAILLAGGFGVFVDNGMLALERSIWLEIAGSDDPAGLLGAFVNVVRSSGETWTLGMHALGHRDVCLAPSGNAEADRTDLLRFLSVLCACDGARPEDGDLFDGCGRSFRIRCEPCRRIHAGSPAHNPFGCIRLEAIEGAVKPS